MKVSFVTTAVVSTLIYSLSPAGQLSVTIDGLADPTTFTNLDPSLDLRVTPLITPPGGANGTHILIEGLSPMGEGSLNYASNYSGIDVNTGAIQDSGVLYLKMPSTPQLPAGSVASPIVGVVARTGGWEDYALSYPGIIPSGIGFYDGSSLSLALDNGSDVFSGTVNYSVMDEDTLVLSPFTLTGDGVTSYSMSESVLFRNGDRFYGALTNLDQNANYDSLIFSIGLDSIPDIDLDSLPDITDPALLSQGNWGQTSAGWVWNAYDSVGYSTFMGWIDLGNYPIIYHFKLGWLQVISTPQSPDTGYWMHSPLLGWIFADSAWNGDFLYMGGQGWMVNNFFNPSP